MVYALLALAVIVSLFGIVNTLALSIYERTRELGLMRAVGMSRRQVRRIIRYESVITALIGAVLGSLLGVIFAVIMCRPLADEGFMLSIPVGTLIVLLVLAALAGVLAAIGPARRASRLDVLDAWPTSSLRAPCRRAPPPPPSSSTTCWRARSARWRGRSRWSRTTTPRAGSWCARSTRTPARPRWWASPGRPASASPR